MDYLKDVVFIGSLWAHIVVFGLILSVAFAPGNKKSESPPQEQTNIDNSMIFDIILMIA